MTKFKFKPTKLKLQNLESVYSRLINKKIESGKIKKVNSDIKIYQEKSLQRRVFDITKLIANLNLLASKDRLNIILNKSLNVCAGEILNQSLLPLINQPTDKGGPLLKTKSNNMLDNYITYQQNQRKTQMQTLGGTKIRRYLQAISSFDPSVRELALSQNIVYNFNNSIKKFKLDSILENSFYSKNCIPGTKVYEITPNNLTIQLFFLKQKRMRIRLKDLNYLCAYISKKIKKPIKLDLIRLKSYNLDSLISARAIGILSSKFKYVRIVSKFIRYSIYTTFLKNIFKLNTRNFKRLSFITGINVKLGGRLRNHRLTNRNTTRIKQKGSLNRASTDIVTTSRLTSKVLEVPIVLLFQWVINSFKKILNLNAFLF